MMRTTIARVGFTLALAFLPAIVQAEPVLIYDVDFGTPPHTVGQPPAVGSGSAPRRTPTAIVFGDPKVVAAQGALTDQPCLFGNGTSGYDQLQFSMAGLPADSTYRLELQVLVEVLAGSWPNDDFSIILDLPTAHSIRFMTNGEIRAGQVIGQFQFGVPVLVAIDLDIPADRWTIYLDGTYAYSGPIVAEELRSIRLNLKGAAVTNVAAVDNLRIYSGVVTPPPGACCLDDGSCVVQIALACAAAAGTFQGDGTTCQPNGCPGPGAGWCDDFDDGDLSGWTMHNPFSPGDESITIEASSEQSVSLGHSLKISSPAPEGSSGDAVGPEVPIDRNQPYRVSWSFRYEDFHWFHLLSFGPIMLTLDDPESALRYCYGSEWGYLGTAPLESYCPPGTWKRFRVEVNPGVHAYDVYVDDLLVGSADYGTYDTGYRGVRIFDPGGGTGCFITDGYYDNVCVLGSLLPLPDPAQSAVSPWDGYRQAFVSPGIQSGVDALTVMVRDALGNPLPNVSVVVDVSGCDDLCLDGPETGLAGMTDAQGRVTLDPRAGGCDECPVKILADGTLLRSYGRVVSTDWDGAAADGRVDAADAAFLRQRMGTGDPCADYDGDGQVGAADSTLLVAALDLDANSQLCVAAGVNVPAPGGLSATVRVSANPSSSGRGREVLVYLPRSGRVTLELYEVSGRVVRTLADGSWNAGTHRVSWPHEAAAGGTLRAGTYFLRLRTEQGEVVTKVTEVR
jgi:hypothetical protein